MTVKYINPENKEFSSVIVSGEHAKKVMDLLNNKELVLKTFSCFSKTLLIAKKQKGESKCHVTKK